MAADDPVCLCGDKRSEHRLGRKGCKALDCGCSAFEAADDAAEKERVNRALIPVLEDNADRMRAELGEQSISARLREVERELFETQELVDQKQQRLMEASDLLTATRARQEQTERERDMAQAKLDSALLQSAAEVARVREQRDGFAARVDELQVLLEHAEQYARDLQSNGDVAPVEIHGWDAWQCFTCGSRYRRSFDHACGPLRPVRVSITERKEQHP
jgi:hypothetical protein